MEKSYCEGQTVRLHDLKPGDMFRREEVVTRYVVSNIDVGNDIYCYSLDDKAEGYLMRPGLEVVQILPTDIWLKQGRLMKVWVVIGVYSGIIDCIKAWSTEPQATDHAFLLGKSYNIKPGYENQSLHSVKMYELAVK